MVIPHVGVVLPPGGDPAVGTAARRAERAGLDGVWSGDHLVVPGMPYLSSTALLAAAAAVTERVTVGWSVMLPALRPPAWAAQALARVQQISGGRLQLGVGLGPPGPEWRAAGTSATGRAARTDAFLAALPDLLAGRAADPSPDGDGPTSTLEPAVPAPPLWIGGTSDAALRRVARFGAGWLGSMLVPSAIRRRAADLAALLPGDAPPSPVGSVVFAAPGGPAESVRRMLTGRYGVDDATAAELALGGPPEQLAEQLARFRDAGVDTLVVVPIAGDVLESYDLLGAARALL